MAKLMVHLVKFIVATIIGLLFSSCNFNIDGGKTIHGSGKVVTKLRNLSGFTKIEVSKGLDCEVILSKQFKVAIIADDNMQDAILTTVENGTLKINSKYNRYDNVESKKIVVYLPVIESLEATSASHLETQNTIRNTELYLKTSSAGEIEATVESDKISLESSSGSSIKVQGKALEISTSSSSGSHIDASDLLANEIHAQSSSGSTTEVHPLVFLNAHASSGSAIHYVNNPKRISKEENSGGSVSED
jgi:Putative auto-transporter adhesin, head GIN domain